MIYFTSDHHFDHKNIIEYCNRKYKLSKKSWHVEDENQKWPFTDVNQMNEHLIGVWNETVNPDDIVYYLGDFSLSIKAVEKYSKRLNGTKYMIPGNHDACFPFPKMSDEKLYNKRKLYLDQGWRLLEDPRKYDWSFIYEDDRKPGVIESALMCHLPYRGDSKDNEYEERYSSLRLPNEGKWLLHGHVHEKWKVKDKQINVGVDVWDYKPVSINEIQKIMENYKNGK